VTDPRRPRSRPNLAPDLSPDEVAARLGLPYARRHEPSATIVTTPVRRGGPPRITRRAGVAGSPPDRRRVLWWDSVTIVGGVVLSLLALQLLGNPQFGPVALASPSDDPTGAIIETLGPLGTPTTVPQPETLGPVIDPSLGLDASPTPIPVITLGPTPTARPGTPPVADFTWVQTGSRRIAFTSTSSGGIATYRWTFGDGGTATTPNPVHVYPAHDGYSVRLTVTGPGGSATRTRLVSVVKPTAPPATPGATSTLPPTIAPTPVVTPPPAAATAAFGFSASGLPLTLDFFDESSGSIDTWSWDFGDGQSSTARNPSHTYLLPGTYSVTLTVTGPGGQDMVSHEVTVS
jgi:PKD repeat protein